MHFSSGVDHVNWISGSSEYKDFFRSLKGKLRQK